MSRVYACVIAESNGWGEATVVRAVVAPLTLEEAIARLAQRHAGEIGRVLRLPAALPEPGTVLKDGMSAAPSPSAWQIRGEPGRWRRHAAHSDGSELGTRGVPSGQARSSESHPD